MKKDPIADILFLILSKDSPRDDGCCAVLDTVGVRLFVELSLRLGGRRITFPTYRELKESLCLAFCYYYREKEGRSWDEIRSMLKIDEFDVNPISYGLRIRSLNRYIRNRLSELIEKDDDQETKEK